MNRTATAALVLVSLAGLATGQATIELLPPGFLLTDLSANGTIGAGNVQGDGSYETFRWTTATGVQRLGLATVPVIGTGAGSPDISFDGSTISATILSSDQFAAPGVWNIATGWTEIMPPPPPDGASQDQSYGSAWGLSGNGAVLTGLYSLTTGRAAPFTWSQSTGTIHLPHTLGKNCRVNGSNFDGSVVVGWEDTNGPWQPIAWRNGARLALVPFETVGGGGEGLGVSADGSVIVGKSNDPAIATRVATIWRWDGAAYQPTRYGYLPGTIITFGQSLLESVSSDGQIAVGANYFTNNPGAGSLGAVWTPETGLVNAATYIAGLGVSMPANLPIRALTSVSADGRSFTGYGLTTDTFQFQSFVIHLPPPPPVCPGDFTGDSTVNVADLVVLLGQFGQAVPPGTGADMNNDGVVNTIDLTTFLARFGQSC